MNIEIDDKTNYLELCKSNDINTLKKEYNDLLNDITTLKNTVQYKEKKAEILLENIQLICEHKWIMDKPEYGSKTTYTCSICDASSM